MPLSFLCGYKAESKLGQNITITVATVKCQKPEQALGLRCPHYLLPKQYMGGLGFNFSTLLHFLDPLLSCSHEQADEVERQFTLTEVFVFS